jgi:hypothetical protein
MNPRAERASRVGKRQVEKYLWKYVNLITLIYLRNPLSHIHFKPIKDDVAYHGKSVFHDRERKKYAQTHNFRRVSLFLPSIVSLSVHHGT